MGMDDLTPEEKSLLAELPADAVSHWLRGERWDSKKKRWVFPRGTKTFVKPTLAEVKEYCLERKNNVDPETWYDHYESNGWMVGRTPMQNWKAAVRTWERMAFLRGNGGPNHSVGAAERLRRTQAEAARRRAEDEECRKRSAQWDKLPGGER